MALALPTARVSRCEPPMPGMTPSLISGWPKTAVSAASRMSQSIASSQPRRGRTRRRRDGRRPELASAAQARTGDALRHLLAADTAVFGQPEIKLGVIPGIGGSQRLTRAVGKAKAMELCLTGRTMDAAEAERAGLVSRIVPADDLVEEAMAVARPWRACPCPWR